MGTDSAITSTFETLCKGKNSCSFNITASHVSAKCSAKFPSAYIFMNALCESTSVDIDFGLSKFTIEKSDIALVAVICDVAATLIFAAGIALYHSLAQHDRLGYYEREEVRVLKKRSQYVADYSVEIGCLYDFKYTDPLALKQALWKHIETVMESQRMNPDWRIFDIQLAQSDTHFIDLLETLQSAQKRLRLTERRSEKSEAAAAGIEKLKEKVKAAEKAIEEYKNAKQQPYIIKAFVTFTSTQAARTLHDAYDFNCCSRNCCASDRYATR